MIKLGITGVMGAGKSSVAGVLSWLGVPVYDCDSRAKFLINSSLRADIEALFGSGAFLGENQGLDSKYIASQIFSNSDLKARMESIVHTAVVEDIEQWSSCNSDFPILGVESAILLGSRVESVVDKLLVVHCPCDELYDRIAKRSGLSVSEIEARLSTQMSQQEMVERADFSLFTSVEELLVPKVVAFHEKLLSL